MRRASFAAPMPAGRFASALLEAVDEVEVASPVRRSLEVGAADDHAEREADAIADQVLGRIAERHEHAPGCGHDDAVRRSSDGSDQGIIGAAGGELGADAVAAIESARGAGSALDGAVRREMEAGFGRSLDAVRIHTDARADRLSRQMSARAFTTGKDIFFARGEYDPSSAGGRHTLAHELAHTVQDSGPARRKLRGTAEALVSQGEEKGDKGKSSGFLRTLTGKLTNWDRIVGAVRAYEAEEGKLLAGGRNPDPMALMSAKPGMLKLLTKVQSAIAEWRKANASEKEDDKAEKKRKGPDGDRETNLDADPRTKAGRRQAIALLEPRVSNEVRLLSAQDSQAWLTSLGLAASKGTETGRVFGGQMNQVTEVAYQTESGDLTGFFKEDKGFNKDTLSHESVVGIKQTDPNYGARSVALYRLDQLFNAQVTARAEFAVHKGANGKSTLGTVLESVKGQAASKTGFAMTEGHKQQMRQGGDATAVSLEDPVLQRGLNKLQLLDAISGQLDRHSGNYHVESDEQGNVLGVTGIDLDMAFGSKMTGVDKSHADGAFNYKGLPEFIDEEMGLKILQVQPGDVRDALTGLLPKAEVEATVARFREVQTAVMEAQQNKKLRSSWGGSRVDEGSSFKDLGSRWHDRPTYLDEAKGGARYDLLEKVGTTARALAEQAVANKPGGWEDLPADVPPALARAFGLFREGQLTGPLLPLAEALWQASAADQATSVVTTVVAQAMQRATVDRVWVDLQESSSSDHAGTARSAMEKRIEELVASMLPKIRAGKR